MNKAVLMSIQPKWCELIASGKKTVEVRKTKPKIEPPFKCYIYETKMKWFFNLLRKMGLSELANKLLIGKGKVIGEFVCNRFVFLDAYYDSNGNRHLCNTAFIKSCVPDDELFDYLYGKHGHKHGGWAWHISDLVIYDKPKELREFKQYCDGVGGSIGCRGCEYYYTESNESIGTYEECLCDNSRPLKRPPQSWCYVEELKGDRTE